MVKKLTIEQMKEIAKSRGGECLSDEYLNVKIQIKWQCSKGHNWMATPDKVKRGSWCPYCAGRHQTIEDMKNIAHSHNGECVSNEYLNNKTPLKCNTAHLSIYII